MKYYVVEVAWNSNNPIHRTIVSTFDNNLFEFIDYEDFIRVEKDEIHYFKIIAEIKEMNKRPKKFLIDKYGKEKNMKSAEEMFEELGYRKIKSPKNYEHLVLYEKCDIRNREISTITFNKYGKNFSKELKGETWCIAFEELQAINKQVEEFGWK